MNDILANLEAARAQLLEDVNTFFDKERQLVERSTDDEYEGCQPEDFTQFFYENGF